MNFYKFFQYGFKNSEQFNNYDCANSIFLIPIIILNLKILHFCYDYKKYIIDTIDNNNMLQFSYFTNSDSVSEEINRYIFDKLLND